MPYIKEAPIACTVGLLIALSSLLINPWIGQNYRDNIVNYRDVMLIYFWSSLSLGLLVAVVGWWLYRRNTAKAAIAVLIVICFALIALFDRLLLAYFGLPYWIPDSSAHYSHRPSSIRTWWVDNPTTSFRRGLQDRLISINSHGHHDDDFPLQKPKGELRGLLLGGGVTMGYGVDADEAYANQLEEILRSNDTRFLSHQMINAGVQGYSTAQELQILEKSLVTEPDFIAVGFCLDDIVEPYWYDERFGGTGWFYGVSQSSSSLLGYLLNETGYGRLIQQVRKRQYGQEEVGSLYQKYSVKEMATTSPADLRFRRGWQNALDGLDEIYALAEAHNIPVVLLIFPYTFQLFNDELKRPQEILIEHARRHSVEYIDFARGFEEVLHGDLIEFFGQRQKPLPPRLERDGFYALQQDCYFLDGNHFTGHGHCIVAARLAEYLHTSNLVELDPATLGAVGERPRCEHICLLSPATSADLSSILRVAQYLLGMGDLETMEQFYIETLADSDDEDEMAQILNLLGNLYFTQKQFDQALHTYQRVLPLAPQYPRLYGNIAASLENLGRLEEAAHYYEDAIHLNPLNHLFYHNLGKIRLTQGDKQGAVEAFQKAVQLESDDIDTFLILSRLYREDGQQERALKIDRLLIEDDLSGTSSEVYTQLGINFYNSGRFDDAIKAYRRALERDEDNLVARINLGWIHLTEGAPDEAIREYRSILARRPHEVAQFNLGLAYLVKGEFETARKIYAQGIEQFGAELGEKIGAVDDLEDLIAQGVHVPEVKKILQTYWHR